MLLVEGNPGLGGAGFRVGLAWWETLLWLVGGTWHPASHLVLFLTDTVATLLHLPLPPWRVCKHV